MKKIALTAALLLAALHAAGQTPTVTINGTVSANGTITGNGVNSSVGSINLLCAYYSTYSNPACTSPAPGNGWAAALAAAAQGQPPSTSAASGAAALSGTARLQ